MAGCYGNQASILNFGDTLAAEGVVTQFDHIRLQWVGKGRGRRKENKCMKREHFTDTQSALTLSVISSATHTLLMPAALFMASISWKTPVVTAEVVARPSSYYEQEERGRGNGLDSREDHWTEPHRSEQQSVAGDNAGETHVES